ncbi:CPBP family intramembrane glutamic endopeptidase [Cryobacterium aureum]|uniref:CPBP family intramembrane glutamic endopeptidase n=1 Tax=Cryobacterium aureum TaxID=995037 RepID=UPI000CF4E49B|nr:CPBP family intramembrane glutamic endopeptidase [Cryobacterium aureum]
MPKYELSGLDAAVHGRIVTVAVLALGACQPVFGSSLPFVVLAAVVALSLGLWLRHADAPEAKDAVVLVFFLYVVGLIPVVGLWPIGPAIAITITAVISWRAGRLRRWRHWLRIGRLDGITWVTVAAVAGVSVVGLLLWQSVFDGQLPVTYRQLIESVSAPVAVTGALGFAIVNGAIEDSIFFGILLTPMLRYFPPRWAVSLTALAFGLAHFHGVPSGVVGVILAGSWAVMLGYLRTRTGGMFATYLAHIIADATIVAVLIPPLLMG